jgi:hypothetical protein
MRGVRTLDLWGSKKGSAGEFSGGGRKRRERNRVASTKGALSQLSSSWADGKKVFALSPKANGADVAPTTENIATNKYPMSRPLYILTNGEPEGDAKTDRLHGGRIVRGSVLFFALPFLDDQISRGSSRHERDLFVAGQSRKLTCQ